MPSFRVGGIWVLKIEKFLNYALIFHCFNLNYTKIINSLRSDMVENLKNIILKMPFLSA